MIGQEGRELQRRLPEATFTIDAAREERAARVTRAGGIPHGSVEAGHQRGVASVFGPVRVSRMASTATAASRPLFRWGRVDPPR